MFLHTLFSNLIISLIDVKRLAPRSQNMWKKINESPKKIFFTDKNIFAQSWKKTFQQFPETSSFKKKLEKTV